MDCIQLLSSIDYFLGVKWLGLQFRNEIAFSERWVLFKQTTRKPPKYKGFIHIFIQKAIDLIKTLWGINSTSSLVIPQSLVLCFRLNFNNIEIGQLVFTGR